MPFLLLWTKTAFIIVVTLYCSCFLNDIPLDGWFLDLAKLKIDNHFDDFGQVKIGVHFAHLGQFKIFNKTPLVKTRCLDNSYLLLTGCLGIQFFDSITLFSTQSVRLPFGYLPLTVPQLCDLQHTMSFHYSPSAFHPTHT